MTYTNFEIVQGSSFSNLINLTNGDGSPFDLSGYNVRSQIRYQYGDDDVAATFDTSIINSPSGIISLQLPASGAAALFCGQAYFDVEIFDSGNSVIKLVNGRLDIYPEATR